MQDEFYEEFISTVSHELRTPLTSIRGFSQTLLNSWAQLDDKSKKDFIKIIEEQSNRLIHLVENMLTVSKLQKEDNFVYSSVSPNTVISKVVQIIKTKYDNRNFIVNLDKNIPSIFTDSDRFEQIIINLVENATKYSDLNSDIIIQTTFSNTPEFVEINITNFGVEIKVEDYDKLFKKFSRLDNHLTRKVEGSGLGLYITKNLTDKLGGEISFENKEKKTTFKLLMPVSNIENQARAKCVKQH